MSEAQHILRFPLADDESQFVLIQATQNGKLPLDLKLVGTDGEFPYVFSLRHNLISSLRSKKNSLSQEEWEAILRGIFTQEPQKDIQITAQVSSGTFISIAIRKTIQGFSTRLGNIVLNVKENEEVELMDWCGASVKTILSCKTELLSVRSRVAELEKTTAELREQLESALQNKKRDEDVLLEKFQRILNEKKRYIREQLSTGQFQQAAVNTTIASDKNDVEMKENEPAPLTSSTRTSATRKAGRKPEASRQNKRRDPPSKTRQTRTTSRQTKADADTTDLEEEESGNDDDDADDSAPRQIVHGDSADERTEGSEDEEKFGATASEDEDETSSESSKTQAPPTSTQNEPNLDTSINPQGVEDNAGTDNGGDVDEEMAEPPPPRELPFKKKTTAAKSPATPKTIVEDDAVTDSGDEL